MTVKCCDIDELRKVNLKEKSTTVIDKDSSVLTSTQVLKGRGPVGSLESVQNKKISLKKKLKEPKIISHFNKIPNNSTSICLSSETQHQRPAESADVQFVEPMACQYGSEERGGGLLANKIKVGEGN